MASCLRRLRPLAIVAALLVSLTTHVVADMPLHKDLKSYQDGKLGKKPVQWFYSSPLISPLYQANKMDHDMMDPSPYLFLTGRYGELFGPSIASAKDMSLIWADQNYNFAQAAQPYMFRGERVLAVFAGKAIQIYNQHYEKIYSVVPQGKLEGVDPDSHECLLTNDDTVVMIVCPGKEVDLTPLGGPEKGPVANCHVQEVDPVTNEVKFEWATLEYFNITDTIWPIQGKDVFDLGRGPFDFCHMNSVEKTPEGDFLVSYRHLSSIILIDGKTRQVKWVMGGKRNMFKDVTVNGSASFYYQHNPRLTGKNRFTLFDNWSLRNGFCTEGKCSRGLELEYDPIKMTVWVVGEWHHPQSIISASRGGIQRLPSGNTLIAWGQNAMYTEHSPDGEIVMDVQRGQVIAEPHGFPAIVAYRAWKGDWEGKPTWGPNISSSAWKNENKHIYVSWNGATAVNKWVLLLSDRLADLDGPDKVAGESPRLGFETKMAIPRNATYARVAALNDKDKIIGSTPAVHIESGELHPLNYDIRDVVIQSNRPTSQKATGSSGNYTSSDPATVFFEKATDIALAPFYAAIVMAIVLGLLVVHFCAGRRALYRMINVNEIEQIEGERFRDAEEEFKNE